MLSNHCSKTQNLQDIQFSQLFCNALKIKIIDHVPNPFTFVTKLYLNNNNLLSLTGINQFNNLQILSFNFNSVAIFSNLQKIKNKFFLKQLSYIGNPIELDHRSQFQYLKQNMFTKLFSFNNIEKIYFSPVKSKKYQQLSNQSEGYTQRYQQRKFGEYSRKTKRSKYQKTPIKVLQKQAMSQKNLSKLINNKVFEGSTTIHQHPNRSLNQERSLKRNQHVPYDEIFIQPFDQEKQHSSFRQSQQNFLGTARFSQEFKSSNQQQNKRQQISLAIQFLDEQKQEIAQSFRKRYLKQRIFQYLKSETTDENKYIKSQLRRCWVKLRIQSAIQAILEQYREWI